MGCHLCESTVLSRYFLNVPESLGPDTQLSLLKVGLSNAYRAVGRIESLSSHHLTAVYPLHGGPLIVVRRSTIERTTDQCEVLRGEKWCAPRRWDGLKERLYSVLLGRYICGFDLTGIK